MKKKGKKEREEKTKENETMDLYGHVSRDES